MCNIHEMAKCSQQNLLHIKNILDESRRDIKHISFLFNSSSNYIAIALVSLQLNRSKSPCSSNTSPTGISPYIKLAVSKFNKMSSGTNFLSLTSIRSSLSTKRSRSPLRDSDHKPPVPPGFVPPVEKPPPNSSSDHTPTKPVNTISRLRDVPSADPYSFLTHFDTVFLIDDVRIFPISLEHPL